MCGHRVMLIAIMALTSCRPKLGQEFDGQWIIQENGVAFQPCGTHDLWWATIDSALAAHPRIAKVTTRAGGPGGAWRTDPDDPQAQFVTGALAGLSERLVRIRTLGGGVPANAFIDAYHVPTVGVSLANYDDNQHTDNENLRLGNLWNGIRTLAAIMTK